MILSEVKIQNHSCLVMDPPMVPPGAPVIITLHGLGTNADDLASFCEELNLPPCRFVLPDAPFHLPGYPPGSFAWYDFEAHDRAEIEKSRDYLFKVMDRFSEDPNLRSAPGSEKKQQTLIMMGFSQGGVMALEAGLNYKGRPFDGAQARVVAIVSMSGYMPDPRATLAQAHAPRETPILLVHGMEDELVPVQGSRKAAEALKEAGYRPLLKEFPMGHTITLDSMKEVSTFLRALLDWEKES